METRRADLERVLSDRERDAAASEKARGDIDAAKAALDRVADALKSAHEPRAKPPVAGEIEIEPQIKDRSANSNDVLAWAAGLSASQRHALADRLNEATTNSKSKDRDVFGVELANYVASARIYAQFRNVLANPKKHFNAAAYAADRDARNTNANDGSILEAPTPSAPALPDTASSPAGQRAFGPSENEAPEAIVRAMIESGELDTAALESIDNTTRRQLARRLEQYRPGSGDELGAQFARTDRAIRMQLLSALRGVDSHNSKVTGPTRDARPSVKPDEAATPDLVGNFEVHGGGASARIRRTWVREKPIEHWYAVLEAMHEAGAVPWVAGDKTPLERFARKLASGHPMKDEIISFRLDPIAIGIIGLPVSAAPVIERIGDDLLIAVPGVGSTGHGETILLDDDRGGKQEKHNPERFRFLCNALEAYTGLPIVKREGLAAVGVSTTTAVMRLHDRDLAAMFGEAAWTAWKLAQNSAGKRNKKAGAPRNEAAPSPAPLGTDGEAAAASTSGPPASELDAAERERVAAWFATQGASAPKALTRGVYQQVAEIEKDPALAAAVREYLKRGAGNDRPLDEFALRAAIERARVEIDRMRLGLGEFKRDGLLEAFLGPLQETDPFDSATIPARLVQHGLIIAGRSTHFDLALDWGAYRGSTDAEFAKRDWHAVVEWVFERVDAQGPANAGGKPITAPQRLQTEHMGNAIGLDHTFQLGPHEQSGTWMVHAFLRTSHFAPRHVTATVEVKTEAEEEEWIARARRRHGAPD